MSLSLSSKIPVFFLFFVVLLSVGLLPAQQTIGGARSRVGGVSATGDVLCRSSTGTVEACATADFFWNAGLFVDALARFQNASDTTTCFQVLDSDGGTPVFNVNCTDERVCIGCADPSSLLEIGSDSLVANVLTLNALQNNNLILFQSAGVNRGSITAVDTGNLVFSSTTRNLIVLNGDDVSIGPGNISTDVTLNIKNTISTTGNTEFKLREGDSITNALFQLLKDDDVEFLSASSDNGLLLTGIPISAEPGGSVPVCKKYTKTAADLTTSSGTEDEVLFNLPARGKVTGVNIKHSLAFSGGTLSLITVSVGDSSSTTFYTSALDIFQAVSDTTFLDADMFLSSTFAARDVLARFTATGDTMNNVTAGSVDIHVCWVVLP